MDHSDDGFIRNQFTGIDKPFGLKTELRLFSDLRTEQVACGYMHKVEVAHKSLGLGAFAGPRRAEED
jgi:hypothetical protein